MSGEHYKTPRLILLGLIKRVQEEKYIRDKRSCSLADVPSKDISTEQFEFAKHVGQFAVNIYYASWFVGLDCLDWVWFGGGAQGLVL